MQKLKEYKYIILIVLLILGFSFYWYAWRPRQIRNNCKKGIIGIGLDAEQSYNKCLNERGSER
jgi:uncharacterized membrane protein